jgi:hypothetical protein
MKLYFAKYLPVEGEIKEGDLYLADGNLVCKAKIPKKYNNPHVPYFDSYKKVKLFLCSRDIQVGDKFFHNDFPNKEFEVESSLHFTKLIKTSGSYKVIGEISPEATWVVEGDEFDEEHIKRNHICYDTWGNTGYCFHCQRSKGCDSEDYNYLIKGPCGHFH